MFFICPIKIFDKSVSIYSFFNKAFPLYVLYISVKMLYTSFVMKLQYIFSKITGGRHEHV